MERQQGFKHNGVLTAIKEAKQGDLDAIRDFEIKDGEGKKKHCAITFRRTAIPLPPKGKVGRRQVFSYTLLILSVI